MLLSAVIKGGNNGSGCNFDNDNMLHGSLYKSKLILRNLIVVKG